MDWIFRRSEGFEDEHGDAEAFRHIVTSWLQTNSADEADRWLDLVLNPTSPFIPSLVFLTFRSWPEKAPDEIREQLLADRRVDAAEAILVAAPALQNRSWEASAAALATFRRVFRESQVEALVALAGQTVEVEARATDRLIASASPIELLYAGEFSAPGLAVLLLGDGSTETAKARRWSDILQVRREVAIDEARRIGTDGLRRLLSAHRAVLTELRSQQPRERLLVMIKKVERTDSRHATVGDAFLRSELLALLLGNTVKSLRPRHSRPFTRVQIAWANGFNDFAPA